MVESTKKQAQKQASDDEGEENEQIRYYEWTDEMKTESDAIIEGEAPSKLTDMTYRRLDIDAKKNWDIFYKNNTTNFYKDRHYIAKEFSELAEALQIQKDVREKGEEVKEVVLLDLGCGVGNAFWPLVDNYGTPPLRVQCCDFSRRAVAFVQENLKFVEEQMEAS